MQVLHFFLALAVAQVVLANRFTTSNDGDSITGTAGINFSKKEYSSTFQTKSQQSISSNAVPTAPHLPTLALAKPKPPKAKLPGFPEAIPSLHPEIVSVPHPPTYIAHPVNPEAHLRDEHHHLVVLQLSNGYEAVPLDNSFGKVSDYLYLGSEINLVPGDGNFYLPATDFNDGHTTYVNLGTESGHLSLSEVKIGNTIHQGFQGVDDISPVFIPVKRSSQRLKVENPVAYRTLNFPFKNLPLPPNTALLFKQVL